MVEAPVGWQCRNCVKQGAKVSPAVRWRPGAQGRLGNSRITPAVIGIIVACVVAFVIQQTNVNRIDYDYTLIPGFIQQHHQYYRLITSAFLHESVEHIALNMITLAIVGPAVEAEIGRVRFVVVYLVSAFGGAVVTYLLLPLNSESLGASGAIFGVMGVYFVLARARGWDQSTILALIIINLVFSFAIPNVGWEDHVGGLLTGAAVCAGVVYGPSALGRRSRASVESVVYEIGVIVAVAVGIGLLLMLPPGHVNLS